MSLLDDTPALEPILDEFVRVQRTTETLIDSRVIDVPPFSLILSVDTGVNVGPGYRVRITGMYEASIWVAGESADAEYDFNVPDPNNPPGDGLNFPFASITIT